MNDHEHIWLEPPCEDSKQCADDRLWCRDQVFDACSDCGAVPTEYIRADLSRARIEALVAALNECATRFEKALIYSGTDPEFAAEAVKPYRATIAGERQE